jgi:hypothetical protein
MAYRTQTFVRGFIALVVIALTFSFTYRNAAISDDWSAIFLLVIGYYFNDRPSTEEARTNPTTAHSGDARLELLAQFVCAIFLVVATAALFVLPTPRNEIAGAWIGGAALAVGFYFKDTGVGVTAHIKAQAALAIVMLALTVAIYMTTTLLPLQWISLVFLVVAFYFKDRSAPSKSSSPQPDAAQTSPEQPSQPPSS